MQVTGKVVVVTGGGNGIGRAMCEAFHRAGAAKVVVADIDPNAARSVAGAINGAAVGAGLTITLLFDVRFIAQDAKLSLPFTRLGILPDANVHWILPRIVGVSRALELLLSGRTFTGAEAAAMGLASQALPREEVLKTAQAFARDLAENTAPASVATTKRLVYENLAETDRVAAMARETKLVWWLGEQPDAVEGVRARLEQRLPAWHLSKHLKPPERLD